MPKRRGRPKGSQTQPPVSLNPLEPEEALAGLMQVKPEKGETVPKFKSNDKVRVKPDAEDVPDEVKGKEGIVMALDPSRAGFRSLGGGYETADDGAVIWSVHFPELGITLPLHEVWLDLI